MAPKGVLYALTGDVGGTNTRLQLFKVDPRHLEEVPGHQPPGVLVYGNKYRNLFFPTLADVVRRFFDDLSTDPAAHLRLGSQDVEVACLAVAGPVANNSVNFTNRAEWSFRGEDLAAELGIAEVLLINDFVGCGYGLLTLDAATGCHCLHAAPADPAAPIVCIGPGTGLGECFLIPAAEKAEKYVCFPSEGGHAEYAPRKERDVRMLNFLRQKFDSPHRISVERVVSGPGLANVYTFLETEEPDRVDPEFHSRFLKAGDMQAKEISENAPNCTLCNEAVDVFLEAYGSEAGVAALKWMPFGGLYLAGGMTPKLLDRIKEPDGPFLKAYWDKGRVSPLLQNVPLYGVRVDDLGERGAHWKAIARLAERSRRSSPPAPLVAPTPPPAVVSGRDVLACAIGAASAIAVVVALGARSRGAR